MTTPIERAVEIVAQAQNVPFAGAKQRRIVEALVTAGLIATETRWAVRHPDVDFAIVMDRHNNPITTEAEAASVVKQFADGPARVVTRNVTPWKDTP